MLSFELWNHESGNAVGDFDTAIDALAVVLVEIRSHGDSFASDWTLAVTDDEATEPIARGSQLVVMAREFQLLEEAAENARPTASTTPR